MADMAMQLHGKAHQFCFIANSMNFPVKNMPSVQINTKKGSITDNE
jgi:organic hydroperoxide reductase OsmC/OhrA